MKRRRETSQCPLTSGLRKVNLSGYLWKRAKTGRRVSERAVRLSNRRRVFMYYNFQKIHSIVLYYQRG